MKVGGGGVNGGRKGGTDGCWGVGGGWEEGERSGGAGDWGVGGGGEGGDDAEVKDQSTRPALKVVDQFCFSTTCENEDQRRKKRLGSIKNTCSPDCTHLRKSSGVV